MSGAKRGIQSIENAGRILEFMMKTARPIMLKELSDATGLTSGQLHAYLVSLKEIGLVDQENGQGKYLLGSMALSLGFARMRSYDPLMTAATVGRSLALENNLLITISVWDQSKPIIVQMHRGAYDIHIPLQLGSSYQLLASAAGQLFAALLPQKSIAPLVEQELSSGYLVQGRDRPVSIEDWRARAEDIRRYGYSSMRNSPYEGLNAASFPIFDVEGGIQFTLTAMGTSGRFQIDESNRILQTLKHTCASMSKELGFEQDKPQIWER